MAVSPTTEASEIRRRGRQRLIGAIALVMLLVVFVPMVLDSEPRPSREPPALAIPPRASAPPLPAPAPASITPAKPAAASSKAVDTTAPAPAAAAKPAPASGQPGAGTQPQTAAAKVEAAPAAQPRLEGFAVQVGAFRDETKLGQSRQKLADAGIKHYTERLDAPAGPLTRLRAGPFATREAAEAALATLKLAALDGKVVALP